MERQSSLRPQDIIVAIALHRAKSDVLQKDLAQALNLSPAEIIKSLRRLESGHLLHGKRRVDKAALLAFLRYGLRIVFPVQIGSLRTGIKTSLSHEGVQRALQTRSKLAYVWESELGKYKGQCVVPLYPGIEKLAAKDKEFYEILAALEVVRIEDAKTSAKAVKHIAAALKL